MSQGLNVFIMMNNYFHDLATTVLLASGLTMWVIMSSAQEMRGTEIQAFIVRIHKSISKIVFATLVWITISAVPRILTFTRFEWAEAMNRHHITGLTAKHLIMFVSLIAGSYLWININRKIKMMVPKKETTNQIANQISGQTSGPRSE